MWLWNFTWPSLPTCEIHCKILYGLLGLLCERCDSFLLYIFDKVFINWDTCLQELGYRSICLFVWYVCLCTYWYICFQIVFAYKVFFFYFVASVFWLHCFWKIFLLLRRICFQIAIAYRFHMRGLNIHIASIHGDGIGLQFFLLLYTKCSGEEFLDSLMWVYSFHICGCVCFLQL